MITVAQGKSTYRSHLGRVPVPEAGSRKKWEGVNHGALANAVVEGIKGKGLEIAQEKWYVSPKTRNVLFGAIDLKASESLPSLEIGQGASFSLGIRHGNGGEYALSFAVGARIHVCSNGMFFGDFVFRNKHYPGVNEKLPGYVDRAIEAYIKQCEDLEQMINAWRELPLNDKDASYLMMEAHARGYVQFQHLERVHDLWRKPIHEEFEDKTAWTLYNDFTEMAKERMSPPRQMKLLTGLRRMFDGEFGVGTAYTGPTQMEVSLN